MMKWLICQGILYLQTATDKQQCGYDVVGLDSREIWAVTYSVYGHWQTDNETAVILQSLSHFHDSPDSRAADLWWHAESSGNLADETKTRPKVILEAVLAP